MAKFNFEYYSSLPTGRYLVNETSFKDKYLIVEAKLSDEYRYVNDDHHKYKIKESLINQFQAVLMEKFYDDRANWGQGDRI